MRSRWVALAVFALAALALSLAHHTPRPSVRPDAAIRAALAYAPLHDDLAGSHWNRVTVEPVDAHLDRVQFFAGARAVGEVAIGPGPSVIQAIKVRRLAVPYGNWLAYEPAVLIGLGALFVLMAAVAPWRRVRNLDVLAVLSLVAPAILLRERYPDASVLASVPGLGYLLLRCAWTALGPPARAARPPATPLWNMLTASLEPAARVRLLSLLAAALALAFVLIGVSSADPVDVIFAVLEGATRIVHGVLPYGHMPGDIIHGDTYPLLSYAAYVPLALLSPVSSTWDSVDVGLGAAVAAALAAALAAGGVALLPGRGRRRAWAEREAGLRSAVMWLAFPPLLITVSTGTTDVALAALLAMAVLAWRRPAWCTGLLSLAAWFKLAPAALLPVALAPLRGRSLARALAAALAVSVPVLGLLLALGGVHGIALMAHALAYQFSRGSPQSLWAALGIRSLQPVGQAAVLALIAGSAARLRSEPELGRDRARMATLAAAILIGLQLTADYWAFLYLVWFMPMVCVSLLAAPAGSPVRTTASHLMPRAQPLPA